jgi:hypothetical protein
VVLAAEMALADAETESVTEETATTGTAAVVGTVVAGESVAPRRVTVASAAEEGVAAVAEEDAGTE